MNTQLPKRLDRPKGILIIVENLPVPFDRRVWQEATALREAGYTVSVICPKGKGYDADYEQIDDVHIYRHSLPIEASSALGYLVEYTVALFWQFVLSLTVLRKHGFDAIHACNPPDLIFVVAAFHKLLLRKKFVFDQHDINPELYEVKFGKKGLFHRLLLMFERWTFWCADVSLATNETFKKIAVTRGGMPPEKVWVVKSYPDLNRFRALEPDATRTAEFGHLIGYVGIMAQQDGVNLLVRAVAYLVHSLGWRNVGCVIIGDGPELQNLEALSKELDVERYIKFTGFLSGEELLANLSNLDVGVIPDPPNVCNHKLSMNKVFEYMALGLPFVQFDLMQSRSEAGEAALYVEGDTPEALANGIVALLQDEDMRQRMSAYGKRRSHSEFQWETEKRSLLAAYEQLFSQ